MQPIGIEPQARKARSDMDRSILSLLTSTVLLSSAIACGSADGIADGDETASRDNGAPDDTIASRADALTWRGRSRFRLRAPAAIPPAGTGGTTSSTGDPGAASAPSSAPAATADSAAAVDAARTADGQAIPQSSLAGGVCPAVVAAVGFWSCVTVGDQCTFASGGVTHHCSCIRVDGEGQVPAWSCD